MMILQTNKKFNISPFFLFAPKISNRGHRSGAHSLSSDIYFGNTSPEQPKLHYTQDLILKTIYEYNLYYMPLWRSIIYKHSRKNIAYAYNLTWIAVGEFAKRTAPELITELASFDIIFFNEETQLQFEKRIKTKIIINFGILQNKNTYELFFIPCTYTKKQVQYLEEQNLFYIPLKKTWMFFRIKSTRLLG